MSLPWALVLFLRQELHLLPSLHPCKCLQKVSEFTRNGWGGKCRGVLPSLLNVKWNRLISAVKFPVQPGHLWLLKNGWSTTRCSLPRVQRVLFNIMWRTKSRVPHSICICCPAKITTNVLFIPLLGWVRPPTPAEITDVAFPAHSESCDVERDRKEEQEWRH